MTPQSQFMVTAALLPGREAAVRALLASMTLAPDAPGVADPANAVLPFGAFETVHYARLAVLDDATAGDLQAHGLPRPVWPVYLTLLGDCDGPARDTLAAMAERAGDGLTRLFAHCEGFDAAAGRQDLLGWMLAHDVRASAAYVNWTGRTVRQVREESALQRALAARLRSLPDGAGTAQMLRAELVAFAREELHAGRLTLTPPAPTPAGWWLRNAAHAVLPPLVAVLLLVLLGSLLPWWGVLLAVGLPLAAFSAVLRRHETTDPDLAPRPDAAALARLQRLEDRDVTNPFTALGAVKPGAFRRWTLVALLAALDYAARHLYARGHLTRVQTIHFARWVFLDGRRRVLFASNYDGSHESYMDDFINKVGWGLNVVFSNGVGYPATRWLLARGSRTEQRFKPYLRRHQLPTDVWYRAYPGLTAQDLARNHRIREGLERPSMTDAAAVAWLKLL